MAIQVKIIDILRDTQKRAIILDTLTLPPNLGDALLLDEQQEIELKHIYFRFDIDSPREVEYLYSRADLVYGWKVKDGSVKNGEQNHPYQKLSMIVGYKLWLQESYIWTQYVEEKKPKKK